MAQPRCDTTVSIAGSVRGVWGGKIHRMRGLRAYRLFADAGALAPVPPLGKIGRGGPACLCNVSDLFSPRRRVAAGKGRLREFSAQLSTPAPKLGSVALRSLRFPVQLEVLA